MQIGDVGGLTNLPIAIHARNSLKGLAEALIKYQVQGKENDNIFQVKVMREDLDELCADSTAKE